MVRNQTISLHEEEDGMSDVTQIDENEKTWITELNLVIAGILALLILVFKVDPAITLGIAGVTAPLINLLVRLANKKGWI